MSMSLEQFAAQSAQAPVTVPFSGPHVPTPGIAGPPGFTPEQLAWLTANAPGAAGPVAGVNPPEAVAAPSLAPADPKPVKAGKVSKAELEAQCTALGITIPPRASKADLEALIARGPVASNPAPPPPPVDLNTPDADEDTGPRRSYDGQIVSARVGDDGVYVEVKVPRGSMITLGAMAILGIQ